VSSGRMEGIYENFPSLHHGIAIFSCRASPQSLQRILICLFCRINRGEEALEIPLFTSQGIRLVSEIGIADGLTFNFIDEEERDKWLSLMEERVFEVLDFIWIARYYISEKGRDKPLKFDYYMLRFIFRSKAIELRVHHERGTRRLPIEGLIRMLSEKINQELRREGEGLLNIESLSAL